MRLFISAVACLFSGSAHLSAAAASADGEVGVWGEVKNVHCTGVYPYAPVHRPASKASSPTGPRQLEQTRTDENETPHAVVPRLYLRRSAAATRRAAGLLASNAVRASTWVRLLISR